MLSAPEWNKDQGNQDTCEISMRSGKVCTKEREGFLPTSKILKRDRWREAAGSGDERRVVARNVMIKLPTDFGSTKQYETVLSL